MDIINIDINDFPKLAEKKEIKKSVFTETYIKTKMLLNQEVFYEIIVNGLYDVCEYLYYNNIFNTAHYKELVDGYDISECDGAFVSFVITCISIIMNYTFEDAVLYIFRLKSYDSNC